LGQGCFRERGRAGLEFVAGLVVGAAEGVLVARELDEDVVFAVPKEGDAEQAGFLVVGAVLDQAHLFQAVGHEAALDANHAAEAPLGPGHLAEAALLGFVGGAVDGAEAAEEGLELGGVLDGEDGIAGGEAVGPGWHGKTSLGRVVLR